VAEEQYRDRELKHYYDHDGCLVIKALEMAMEKQYVGAASAANDANDVTAETSELDGRWRSRLCFRRLESPIMDDCAASPDP